MSPRNYPAKKMLNFVNLRLNAAPRLGAIMAPDDNSLGLVRLVLALLVLASHSYQYLGGSMAAEPLNDLTGRSLGEYSVQVFFVLSGLLVAKSFQDSSSILDFTAARVLRIFPALIVCVALTALVLGPAMSSLAVGEYFSDTGLFAYVAKTLSLSTGAATLPGVFETTPLSGRVNTSLWTLKYEALCYGALALSGCFGLFNPRRRALAVIGLSLFVLVIFCNPPALKQSYAFTDSLSYFSVFFGTGVLAYLLRYRIVLSAWLVLPMCALFLCSRGTNMAELGSAMSLGYLALYAATKTYGPLRAFANRMDLSYGVYIYAGPLQQSMISLIPGIGPIVLSLLTMLLVMPIALMSWLWVEKPALRMRHNVGLFHWSPIIRAAHIR